MTQSLATFPLTKAIVDNSSRQSIKIDHNETPSSVPEIFWKLPETIAQEHPYSLPFGKFQVFYSTPTDQAEFLDTIEEDVSDLFELRIQLFLQQLLLVTNTGLQFQPFKATHQVKVMGAKSPHGNYLEETHIATLPSLLAISPEESYSTDAESSIFCWNSDVYKVWNSIMPLPKYVNTMDTLLQDHRKQLNLGHSTLKKFATRLLSGVAQNHIRLIDGLLKYIKAYQRAINKLLSTETSTNPTYKVLQIYLSVCESYLDKDPQDLLKNLLFLHKSEESPEELIRGISHRLQRKTIIEIEKNNRIDQLSKYIEEMQNEYKQPAKINTLAKILISNSLQRIPLASQRLLENTMNDFSSAACAIKYAYKCICDPNILEIAQAVFTAINESESLSMQSLKTQISMQSRDRRKHQLLKTLHTQIKEKFGGKNVQNSSYIIARILYYYYLFTNSNSKENPLPALVHHTLCYNDFQRFTDERPGNQIGSLRAKFSQDSTVKQIIEEIIALIEKNIDLFNSD